MSDQAVRQRYRIATGGGQDAAPPSKPNPGFRKGGTVKKQGGGSMYKRGGSSKKR